MPVRSVVLVERVALFLHMPSLRDCVRVYGDVPLASVGDQTRSP